MLAKPSEDCLVEIYSIEHNNNKTSTIYHPVTNNYIIMQVYELFKEKYQTYYGDYIKVDES